MMFYVSKVMDMYLKVKRDIDFLMASKYNNFYLIMNELLDIIMANYDNLSKILYCQNKILQFLIVKFYEIY